MILFYSLLLSILFATVLSTSTDSPVRKTLENAMASKAFLGEQGEIVLIKDTAGNLLRTDNYGISWDTISMSQFNSEKVKEIVVHENDPQKRRVFVITQSSLYKSTDGGKQFEKINLPNSGMSPNTLDLKYLDFHPSRVDWLVFLASIDCPGSTCHTVALVSKDNGQSWTEVITYADKCIFAKDTSFGDVDEEDLFCAVYERKNGDQSRFRREARTIDGGSKQLLTIKSPFNTNSVKEVLISSNVVEFYVFQEFLGIAVEEEGNGVKFKSTRDGKLNSLGYAQFPPKAFDSVKPEAYTILQSPEKRIFVDALMSRKYNQEMGSLFVSDADGKYFNYALNNTNRNLAGYVDYERLQGIKGVIIANRIQNWDKLGSSGSRKEQVTMISTNDGGDWRRLAVDGGSAKLNLHSRSELSPDGPIFSIKSSASVAVAVGNTGEKLEYISDGHTYLSRDAGSTWKLVVDKNTHHEIIASGSIVVAAPATDKTSYVYYLDVEDASPGTNWDGWQRIQLSDEITISQIIGQSEGRGLGVLVLGYSIRDNKPVVFSIVFRGETCKSEDLEQWSPGQCFMGEKNSFWRRKPGKSCLLDSTISNPQSSTCDCGRSDVECDWGFALVGQECVAVSNEALRKPISCVGSFDGPSGYRKIPGSKCRETEDFKQKYLKQKQYQCSGAGGSAPVEGGKGEYKFPEKVGFEQIFYITNTTSLVATSKRQDGSGFDVWQTTDLGVKWEINDKIKASTVIQNQYFDNFLYLFASQDPLTMYVLDAKSNINSPVLIKLPSPPALFLRIPLLELHATDSNMLIYFGSGDCDNYLKCHSIVYWSEDAGVTWRQFQTHVTDCQWGFDSEFRETNKRRVYCNSYKNKQIGQKLQRLGESHLEYTDDFKQFHELFDNTFGFAINERYLVAAYFPQADNRRKLALKVSTNGDDWRETRFPPGVDFSSGYTVLESHSGSLTVGVHDDQFSASIYVSDSSGTSFSLSRTLVNKNSAGFIDYERMLGIEGVAILNVLDQEESQLGSVRLKSLITYNNGGQWHPIPAPTGSSDFLHLYGFTKRSNTKNEISDIAAPGIFLGIGNVGKYLNPSFDQAENFISIDAGRSWRKLDLSSGPHFFEFADHGNLLLFVPASKFTTKVYFSFNFGQTLTEMTLGKISGPIMVERIVTEPDSTSLVFMLFGRLQSGQYAAVPVDFSNQPGLKQCQNSTDPNISDFELFTVKDPFDHDDECVFGRKKRYYRRKIDRSCYVGELFPSAPPVDDHEECQCKAEDFECAPDYYRKGDKCELLIADNVKDVWSECIDGRQYWNLPVRKIDLSQCSDPNKYLSKSFSQYRYCGGSGSSGFRTFLIVLFVLLPISILGYVGYWAYLKHQRGEPFELPEWMERWREYLPRRFQGGPRYEPLDTGESVGGVGMLMDDYS